MDHCYGGAALPPTTGPAADDPPTTEPREWMIIANQTLSPRAVAAGLSLLMLLGAAAPALAADSDGDGLRDAFERKWTRTDPLAWDSDGDGIVDSVEDPDRDQLSNLGEQRFGLDPRSRDTDRDGKPDGAEDHDRDGRKNILEQDQRRVPYDLRPTLSRAGNDKPKYKDCVTANPHAKLRRCFFGDPDGKRVLLMGDSHALMWLPAFRRSAEAEGWRFITLLRVACPPLVGLMGTANWRIDRGRSCDLWRKRALAWLRDNPPDLIVITHTDNYALLDSYGRAYYGAQRLAAWRTGMRKTLRALPRRSEVLILGDTPDNRVQPVLCLSRNLRDMSACQTRRVPADRRLDEAALRKAALANGAEHVPMYGLVCNYDPCPLVHDNILLWRDHGHITKTISVRLTPSVRRVLKEHMPGG